MKKFIVNEDWLLEDIEDRSNFFVLVFKHGSDSSYIKNYSANDLEILAQYDELLTGYNDTKFEKAAKILVIKLPNTPQVKTMLETALYAGDSHNKEKIEIIDHLLNRADCEYIKTTSLSNLEEAKKRKKRKRAAKISYTTGCPWYNDMMFNRHHGTDFESEKEGSSLDGEPAGGNLGENNGSLGENLKEALTPFEKMQALENGTRGFNAAAASEAKLRLNYDICVKYGFNKAKKIIENELRARGLLTTQGNVKNTIDLNSFKIDINELHPADVRFIVDNIKSITTLITNIESADTDELKFRFAFITLLYVLYLKEVTVMNKIKDYIIATFNIDSNSLKQFIKTKILTDSKLTARLIECIQAALTESLTTEGNKNMKLTEAKRYIKRYYIRPQNIFCSNKAEILQALVQEVKDNNCSVYSLKSLADHDDVHLLQPSDIIYYYDDGILYDKNHIKVMDYDLNVKHEEDRKKFGNVDAISDKTFEDEYEDRLTESIYLENEFNLDFDDVNVFGEVLVEGTAASFVCCICGEEVSGPGNNPSPIKESGKCCDACNRKFVLPARILDLN